MDLKAENIPASEGYQVIGKLQKAHGVRGEVFLYVFPREAEWLGSLKEVSLIRPLPGGKFEYLNFPVVTKRWHKEGIIARLKGVDNRNQSEELKGCFFEVPQSFFVSESQDDFYLQEILNFSLMNVEKEILGEITGFSSNGIQDLAEIQTERGVFEVPLIDDWIVEILHKDQSIIMDLPLGLLGEEGVD